MKRPSIDQRRTPHAEGARPQAAPIPLAGKLGLGSSRMIGRAETLRRVPTLEPQGLRGGIVYYDGQFDDARLAITLLRTLLDHGGVALNYMPVTGLRKSAGRVAGVVAHDAESGAEFEIAARAVVNATGVYVDALRQMDNPRAPQLLSPSQGAHSDAAAVRQVLAERPGWNELLHPDLPYRLGEVVWAARCELARTVEDVLARRTRALLLDARASSAVTR